MRSNLSRWLQGGLLLVVIFFYPGCNVVEKLIVYPDGSCKCSEKFIAAKDDKEIGKIKEEVAKEKNKQEADVTDEEIIQKMKERLQEREEGNIRVNQKCYKKGEEFITEDVWYLKSVKDFGDPIKITKFEKQSDGSFILEGEIQPGMDENSGLELKELYLTMPGKISKSKNITVKGSDATWIADKGEKVKGEKKDDAISFMVQCEPPSEKVLKDWEQFKKDYKEALDKAKAKSEKDKSEKKKSEEKEK